MAEELTQGRWSRAPHLDYLNRRVTKGVMRGNGRFIVEMPPRHGKSEWASHWLPTWFLGWRKDGRVIDAAYGSEFASGWGRKVRDEILNHGDKIGIRLRSDSASVSRWELTSGGGMVTAGVGQGITGRGADLFVIDDPVKDQEEAMSPVYRERAWNWYRTVVLTRLEPGASVVLVLTRWHEDDLAGRLLREAEAGGEQWERIRFPAIATEHDVLGRKPGDALWPERFPASVLEAKMRAQGTYWASAMYQQSPLPPEGTMLRRSWFEIVDKAPTLAARARSWDLAATDAESGEDPDWTCGVKQAFAGEVLYIEDVKRLRGTEHEVRKLMKQTAELDQHGVEIILQQDPGQAGKAQIASLVRMLYGWAVFSEPPTGDKVIRAKPLAALAEAGLVKLVRGDWNEAFLAEIEQFPLGRHDDQVDAASFGLSRLAERGRKLFEPDEDDVPKRRPPPSPFEGYGPKKDTVDDDEDDDDWRDAR